MFALHRYVIRGDRCKRCGRCVAVCEPGAITIPQGSAVTTRYGEVSIDADICTGCGECLKVCKLRAIAKVLKPHR